MKSRRLEFATYVLISVVATVAIAAPAAPQLIYPADNSANIRVNPTLFFNVFFDPGDARTTQEDLEVLVAESPTFGSDVVWQSEPGYGAGMAIHVDAGNGRFLGELACQRSLNHGTKYYVQARRKARGGMYSPASVVTSFSTILPYGPAGGGRLMFVDPQGSDSGDCSTNGQPCRTLSYALSRVRDGGGDDVILSAGVYPLASGQIRVANLPDRFRLRGADPANRPVIKATYVPIGTSEIMNLNNATDVVFEDIIFEGADNCCPTSIPLSSNNYQINIQGHLRVSWENVEFRKGMRLSANLNTAASGAIDTLLVDTKFLGFPAISAYADEQRTYSGYQDLNPRFLTVVHATFDRLTNHISTSNAEHVLLDDVVMTRGIIHPLRPTGLSRNWTVRRLVMDDGLEGFSFGAVDSTVENLSVENSTFRTPLEIGDNAQDTSRTIGYLVLRNNVFIENGGWRLEDCTSSFPANCKTSGKADIFDASRDRISVDYNVYWRASDLQGILTFDNIQYHRRGASSYEDYLKGTGFDVNAPVQHYGNPPLRDTVDPLFKRVQISAPQDVSDFTPQSGSPVIDAGDPSYGPPRGEAHAGGGSRTDIGKVEAPEAPFVRSVNLVTEPECAPEGIDSWQVEVRDLQDAIASLSVLVDGSVVIPTVSGSGSLLNVTIPLGGGLTSGEHEIEVAASDSSNPPHQTVERICVAVRPAAPTGTRAGS